MIIGASVRYGHFNKQVYRFVERHHELLNAKSAVFFGVGLTARKEGKIRQREMSMFVSSFNA